MSIKNIGIKKFAMIIVLMMGTISVFSQNIDHKGPHGGEVIQLEDNFEIEMMKEKYSCLLHPEISGHKNELCSIGGEKLERERKIIFYLFDKDKKELDVFNFKGTIRVVFNDETASTKKIRIDNNMIWVPLGNNGYNNYQQAIVKINFNGKKYRAVFGNPIVHKGHHH